MGILDIDIAISRILNSIQRWIDVYPDMKLQGRFDHEDLDFDPKQSNSSGIARRLREATSDDEGNVPEDKEILRDWEWWLGALVQWNSKVFTEHSAAGKQNDSSQSNKEASAPDTSGTQPKSSSTTQKKLWSSLFYD